jgi:hypothetical protein
MTTTHSSGWFTYADRQVRQSGTYGVYTACTLLRDLPYDTIQARALQQLVTFHDDAKCCRGAVLSEIHTQQEREDPAHVQMVGWQEDAVVMDAIVQMAV